MTNHLATLTGVSLAVFSIPQAADLVQLSGSLVGTALLVWIIVRKERDCERLRQENHELSRELGKKCANCALAQSANSLLTESARDHLNDLEKR